MVATIMADTLPIEQLMANAVFAARDAAVKTGRQFMKSDMVRVLGELIEREGLTRKGAKKTAKPGSNIPPTPAEVTAYSASIGYPLDGQAWCDSYDQKGWKVGDHRMKNWQAAVRNWKTNQYGLGTHTLAGAKAEQKSDYTKPW
jgi:hypothetical protein